MLVYCSAPQIDSVVLHLYSFNYLALITAARSRDKAAMYGAMHKGDSSDLEQALSRNSLRRRNKGAQKPFASTFSIG